MKEFFAKSANGVDVYLDTKNSHALTHFAHSQALRKAARKLVSEMEIEGEITRIDKDTGGIVGATSLVETREEDEIVYGLRPLRETYSRFVKNRKPSPTSWITVDVRRKGGEHFLHTAFIGRLTPSFPGGEYLPEKSKAFWSKHALAWGSQEIVPGTETTECPW